jgi:hypothetical protein
VYLIPNNCQMVVPDGLKTGTFTSHLSAGMGTNSASVSFCDFGPKGFSILSQELRGTFIIFCIIL